MKRDDAFGAAVTVVEVETLAAEVDADDIEVDAEVRESSAA